MKIIDSFMYCDEDLILDIRLNTLNKYVSKFIICEAKFNHNGQQKKLNFDIKNFQKFKDKIIYIVAKNEPENLQTINSDDIEILKNKKILDNALARENFQRNYCLEYLKNFSKDDLILINDLDEIPNLENFTYKRKITIFEQKMFYYKLNLKYPKFIWMGSKICKIKDLKNPQWLRDIKPKRYPFWRFDVLFDNKKYHDLNFIKEGGWHFTNVMTAEKIDNKMRNFLHHLEYEKSGLDVKKIKNLVVNKRVFYNHKADKKNVNKWKEGEILEKTKLASLPSYISDNFNKFSAWID